MGDGSWKAKDKVKGQGAITPGPGSGGMDKEGKGFKQLNVWEKSYELSLQIYKLTKLFPKEEIYGLTAQLRRAAVSVPANIAEGYERNYRKEYLQFLYIAKGSLAEVETYLLLSKDLGYVSDEKYATIFEIRRATGKLLQGLIKSLT